MSGQSWVVYVLRLLISWLRQRFAALAARIESSRGKQPDAVTSASSAQSAALSAQDADSVSTSAGLGQSEEMSPAARHCPSEAAATQEEAVETAAGLTTGGAVSSPAGTSEEVSLPDYRVEPGAGGSAQDGESAMHHDHAPLSPADSEDAARESTANWPVGQAPDFTPDASLDLVEGIEFAFEPDSNAEDATDASRGWVQGDGTRECPELYPIKGNGTSHIYHLPGQASYAATIAERCFATEQDAEENGFRPTKRNRVSS